MPRLFIIEPKCYLVANWIYCRPSLYTWRKPVDVSANTDITTYFWNDRVITHIDKLQKKITTNNEYYEYIGLLQWLSEENTTAFGREESVFLPTYGKGALVEIQYNEILLIMSGTTPSFIIFFSFSLQWLFSASRFKERHQRKELGTTNEIIAQTNSYVEDNDKSYSL